MWVDAAAGASSRASTTSCSPVAVAMLIKQPPPIPGRPRGLREASSRASDSMPAPLQEWRMAPPCAQVLHAYLRMQGTPPRGTGRRQPRHLLRCRPPGGHPCRFGSRRAHPRPRPHAALVSRSPTCQQDCLR
eukprot:scaffold946_cov415-Prasinococcus_capsulatus_cf.AAC.5